MNKTALIIIGVLALIILILLLIGRIPNLKNSISKMNGWVVFALILLLVGAVAFIAVKVFLPEGSESIFSEVEDGSSEGEAREDLGIEEEEKETGTGFGLSEATSGNQEGDTTVYITVSGNTVRIGEVPFADPTVLSDALKELAAQGGEFCLVDDYALAETWHQTEDLLDEAGIRYSTSEN